MEIDATRVLALADRFEQGPALVDREFGKAMQLSVLSIEASAKANTQEVPPKDTGFLSQSITTTVTPVEGRVGTKAPYAAVVEYGRRPGSAMPPEGVLLEWMRRRGIPAELEYVIRRSIARKGTPARRFMERAFKENEQKVRGYFDAAGQAVARQLAGGGR